MVTIVGIGALGSHAALFLRNIEHPITLVDFDRIEMKNTHAQFHNRMNVGKFKVLALNQMMMGLFGRKFEVIPHKLIKGNVFAILNPDSTNLVIDCTDNIEARSLIQNHCKVHDIPCLHGCLAGDGRFARVIWAEQFIPDAEGAEEATCEGGEHLPFYGVAASYLAVEAQRFLETGRKRNLHIGPFGAINL